MAFTRFSLPSGFKITYSSEEPEKPKQPREIKRKRKRRPKANVAPTDLDTTSTPLVDTDTETTDRPMMQMPSALPKNFVKSINNNFNVIDQKLNFIVGRLAIKRGTLGSAKKENQLSYVYDPLNPNNSMIPTGGNAYRFASKEGGVSGEQGRITSSLAHAFTKVEQPPKGTIEQLTPVEKAEEYKAMLGARVFEKEEDDPVFILKNYTEKTFKQVFEKIQEVKTVVDSVSGKVDLILLRLGLGTAASAAAAAAGAGGIGKKAMLGKALAFAGVAGLAYSAKDDIANFVTPSDGTAEGDQSNLKANMGLTAGIGAAGAFAGYRGASQISKMRDMSPLERRALARDRARNILRGVSYARDPAMTTQWQRFMNFVSARSPVLYRKIGSRLAASAALAAVPVGGWVAALVGFGFTAATAIELFGLWREFSKLSPEEKSMWDKLVEKVKGFFSAIGDALMPEAEASTLSENGRPQTNNPEVRPEESTGAPTGEEGTGAAGSNLTDQNVTWSQLSQEQKNKLLDAQAQAEGFNRKGTIPNRANNPGAIAFSEFAKKYGARNYIEAAGGIKIATFDSVEQGRAAQRALWDSPSYRDLPVGEAVRRWRTGSSASTGTAEEVNYENIIAKAIGVTPAAAPVAESETGKIQTASGEMLTADELQTRAMNKVDEILAEEQAQNITPTTTEPIAASDNIGMPLRIEADKKESTMMAQATPSPMIIPVSNNSSPPVILPAPKTELPEVDIDRTINESLKTSFNMDRWSLA